jgi:hypothetical protein
MPSGWLVNEAEEGEGEGEEKDEGPCGRMKDEGRRPTADRGRQTNMVGEWGGMELGLLRVDQ